MDQSFMKEKAVMPLVISMAIPMTISMLVNSLYNIIDSFYVAKISEQAMTALSLVYPAQNLLTAVTVGFAIGVNAVIAYYLGAGLKKLADTAATLGLIFNILHAHRQRRCLCGDRSRNAHHQCAVSPYELCAQPAHEPRYAVLPPVFHRL